MQDQRVTMVNLVRTQEYGPEDPQQVTFCTDSARTQSPYVQQRESNIGANVIRSRTSHARLRMDSKVQQSRITRAKDNKKGRERGSEPFKRRVGNNSGLTALGVTYPQGEQNIQEIENLYLERNRRRRRVHVHGSDDQRLKQTDEVDRRLFAQRVCLAAVRSGGLLQTASARGSCTRSSTHGRPSMRACSHIRQKLGFNAIYANKYSLKASVYSCSYIIPRLRFNTIYCRCTW